MWNPMKAGAREKAFFAAVSALALSACAPEYSLMKAPGVTSVASGTACSFEVSRGLPAADDYVEIGRLEAQFFPAADLEKLRSTVQDDVCAVGGQLVVGEWDGDHFMSAVVFRRRPVSSSATAVGSSKNSATPGPTSAAPAPSVVAPASSVAPPAGSSSPTL